MFTANYIMTPRTAPGEKPNPALKPFQATVPRNGDYSEVVAFTSAMLDAGYTPHQVDAPTGDNARWMADILAMRHGIVTHRYSRPDGGFYLKLDPTAQPPVKAKPKRIQKKYNRSWTKANPACYPNYSFQHPVWRSRCGTYIIGTLKTDNWRRKIVLLAVATGQQLVRTFNRIHDAKVYADKDYADKDSTTHV
jgi:hypothetical protein